jgi:hypothetical protein
MANTIGTPTVVQARAQFQGAFSDMWTVKATISDQDAVAITDTMRMSLTIPGVALGDVVIGQSITNDLSDGTDQCIFMSYVTAADTVVCQFTADAGQYAADDLNSAVVRLIIGRPTW